MKISFCLPLPQLSWNWDQGTCSRERVRDIPSPLLSLFQVLECSIFPTEKKDRGRWQCGFYWLVAIGGSCSWLLVIYVDSEIFLRCYLPLCHPRPDKEPRDRTAVGCFFHCLLCAPGPSRWVFPWMAGSYLCSLMASAYSSNLSDIRVQLQKLLRPPDPRALQTGRRWLLCLFPREIASATRNSPHRCTTVGIWPWSKVWACCSRWGHSPSLWGIPGSPPHLTWVQEELVYWNLKLKSFLSLFGVFSGNGILSLLLSSFASGPLLQGSRKLPI